MKGQLSKVGSDVSQHPEVPASGPHRSQPAPGSSPNTSTSQLCPFSVWCRPTSLLPAPWGHRVTPPNVFTAMIHSLPHSFTHSLIHPITTSPSRLSFLEQTPFPRPVRRLPHEEGLCTAGALAC